MEIPEKLAEVRTALDARKQPPRVSVREFLSWFGAQRRGYKVVSDIRSSLEEIGIETAPDFEWAYIDQSIRFIEAYTEEDELAALGIAAELPGGADASDNPGDPVYRIKILEAANRPPVSVKPGASLQVAVSLMLAHDFSQLPVMANDYKVAGMVSWKTLGAALAMGRTPSVVDDFMEPVSIISDQTGFFSAIEEIVRAEIVLVQSEQNKICGIITTSDLSSQFRTLSEPFLLVAEIEKQVRTIIKNRGRYTEEEIKSCCDINTEFGGISKLTFGQYVRILENPTLWGKLSIKIDRASFCEKLARVRDIRNDVMHFNTDEIPFETISELRNFSNFLQSIEKYAPHAGRIS